MEYVRRLHLAIQAHDTQGVEAAVVAGADVDQAWGVHGTPLCQAINLKSLEMVKFLVGIGADVNESCFDGISPLGMAVREQQMEISQYLITLPGCNLNAVDPLSKQSVLHDAVLKGMTMIVEMLVKHPSCDVTKGNGVGNTSLHLALMHQQTEISKILARSQTLHFVKNYAGYAPVHLVAALGSLEGLGILFPTSVRSTQCELFHRRGKVYNGQCDQESSKINTPQQQEWDQKATFTGDTALHIAVREKQYDLARKLISLGAAVDIQNNSGQTALLLACSANQVALVQELLWAGAPPNVKGLFRPPQELQPSLLDTLARESHLTPLHVAAASNNLDLVKVLVDFDTDVNVCDDHGRCPLHLALLNRASVVALNLVVHPEQKVVVDCQGSSLLHVAARCVDRAAEVTEALLALGCSIDHRDRSGNLPLHEAVCFENTEVARTLLAHGADPAALDRDGTSLMTIAASTGRVDMAAVLAAAGASLDLENPLREALDCEEVEFVRFLVEAGCSLATEKCLFVDGEQVKLAIRSQMDKAHHKHDSSSSDSSDDDFEDDYDKYDGYSYRKPPILKHNQELFNWLQERARNPRTLFELCLEAVRSRFRHGNPPFHAMQGLPLPEKILGKLFFQN